MFSLSMSRTNNKQATKPPNTANSCDGTMIVSSIQLSVNVCFFPVRAACTTRDKPCHSLKVVSLFQIAIDCDDYNVSKRNETKSTSLT